MASTSPSSVAASRASAGAAAGAGSGGAANISFAGRIRQTDGLGQAERAEQVKRLDGLATLLARTAVRDSALLALLSEDAVVTDAPFNPLRALC